VPSAADNSLIVGEFNAASYPAGAPNLLEAALGIYQVLLWYDDVVGVLHINEANELKKPPWAKRAQLAEDYLATQLGVAQSAIPSMIDRMIKLPRWQNPTGGHMQRQNPLGNGLRTLAGHVLEQFGGSHVTFGQEEDATQWFPGIQMPGRSTTPKMDVLAIRGGKPRATISCKWSIRHDRISDPTNECTMYKSAAIQQQIPVFEYFLLTNEFSAARLEKVLNQPCVDGLIHVHEPLLTAIAGPKSQPITSHPKFYDLVDFVNVTHGW
jgi:hypothetical protein